VLVGYAFFRMSTEDGHHRYPSILLFGGPGSGKGTQGSALGTLPGVFHCSSGDIFRALKADDPNKKKVDEYSEAGQLVPDELTIEIWANQMKSWVADGTYNPETDLLLLDGIPRNVSQSEVLEQHIDVLTLIYLDCADPEVLVERIKHRALASGRQDDADENVIRERLKTYEDQTAPILGFYDEALIYRVQATQSPLAVLCDIVAKLKQFA